MHDLETTITWTAEWKEDDRWFDSGIKSSVSAEACAESYLRMHGAWPYAWKVVEVTETRRTVKERSRR